jgi:hypothetical protein
MMPSSKGEHKRANRGNFPVRTDSDMLQVDCSVEAFYDGFE